MNGSDFAQRHGYREVPLDFESPDHLPRDVRRRAGMMFVGHFTGNYQLRPRYVQIVLDALPASSQMWEWYDNVPSPSQSPFLPPGVYDYSEVSEHLVSPLASCDWRLFYTIVENVWSEWKRTASNREDDFAPEFNLLLKSHRIPWELHGGLVIPAADSEFAYDLKYALDVDHPRVADHVSDHHESIRLALAALYRKQPGPDFKAAVSHARDAWRAVVGAVSCCNPEEDAKKAFALIEDRYPELSATMAVWNDLIKAERHPANANQRFPTDAEARFIVMLCVNAVRFLCPTCDAGNDALI